MIVVTTILSFAIAVLAAARITRLVTTDSITMIGRAHVLAKWGKDSWQFKLITCPWCIGFWISSAIIVSVGLWPTKVLLIVLGCFAASHIVGLLARLDSGE